MITRREFLIAGSAGCLLAMPLPSHAQQKAKVWRIGFLAPRSRPDSLDSDYYGAFPAGMRELGYVEGENLVIEFRFADNKLDRLPELAAELVRLKVDVIVAPGSVATSAAQKATTMLPIVMVNAGDPVGGGYAVSLRRPGGNITGLANLIEDFSTKHLEMLLSMVPKLSRVAVLVNPSFTSTTTLKNVEAAAQRAGVKILPVEARDTQQIEKAFPQMARENAGAVIVVQSPLFFQDRIRIGQLAAKNRLPAITSYWEYVEAGILMSYGQNNADSFRRAATYVDKILKGAKPGDLPIEHPTKFDLVINGKTAKALGLTIPQSLLISADKVIE